jgi:hypothetical protein
MTLWSEAPRHFDRPATQARVIVGIAQTAHNRIGEARGRRRHPCCERSIDAVSQPFRDATGSEGRSR